MAMCFPDNAIWTPPEAPEDATPEEIALLEQQIEVALSLAWGTLQVLSAYQIAICPITVRPCKASCSHGSYYVAPVLGGPQNAPFWPQVSAGVWTNVWCGHRGDCSCSTVHQISLPGPVGDIVSVTLDGVELGSETYRVDNNKYLVRMDGEDWPVCQDMNAPAGDLNTFTVTYYHGSTADITVRYAAGILAQEYLLAVQGSDDCRLPSGTTNVVRQGITIEVKEDMFEDGLTSIREVDSVTAKYNPYRQKMPSTVYSPDLKPTRQTTFGR